MTCHLCKAEVPPDIVTCPSCGYPQNGTPEERAYWVNNYVEKDAAYYAEKRFRAAQTALFVYGGLGILGAVLVAILANLSNGVGMTSEVIIQLVISFGLAAVFIVLGVIARSNAKAIFTAAAILMVAVALVEIVSFLRPLRIILQIALFIPVVRAIRHMDDLRPTRSQPSGILDTDLTNE